MAIRHPDGQVVVLTIKAHRSTLTAYVPTPVQVRGTDDPEEMALSWMMAPDMQGGGDGDICHDLGALSSA